MIYNNKNIDTYLYDIFNTLIRVGNIQGTIRFIDLMILLENIKSPTKS